LPPAQNLSPMLRYCYLTAMRHCIYGPLPLRLPQTRKQGKLGTWALCQLGDYSPCRHLPGLWLQGFCGAGPEPLPLLRCGSCCKGNERFGTVPRHERSGRSPSTTRHKTHMSRRMSRSPKRPNQQAQPTFRGYAHIGGRLGAHSISGPAPFSFWQKRTLCKLCPIR